MTTTVYFRAANIAACDAWGSGSVGWNPNSAFHDTVASVIASMRLSRGAVSGGTQVGLYTATEASSTARFGFYNGSVGNLFWVTPPLDRDVTIASTIVANLWVVETNMSANIASGCYIAVIHADGSLSSAVATGAAGAEMTADTTAPYATAVQNFNLSPSSTAVHRGERLLIVPYITNIGTMGGGYTAYFNYDGDTAAASGDSYVTFTEDFGFMQDAPPDVTTGGWTAFSAGDIGGSASTQASAFRVRFPFAKTLSGVELVMNQVGSPTDDVVVALQADSAGLPSGTDLTSVSRSASSMPTSAGLALFDWADYAVSADTTYWVVVRRSGTYDAVNRVRIWWTDRGPAPWNGGFGKNNNGGTWQDLTVWPNVNCYFNETTTLYPTTTASAVDPNGATYDAKEMWTSRGSGATTAVTNTAAAPANPLLATVTAGGNYVEWFSRALSAFTLAGPVLVNLRALESNALANATVGVEIAVTATDGTSPTVWGYTLYGLEVTGSEAAYQFFVAGDDVSVSAGQRIRLRIYLDDSSAAAMAASYTATAYYAGSAGATGDTYLTFGQTLSASGTNTAQAVDVTSTLAMAASRVIKKPIPMTSTIGPALSRRTGKPLTVTSALAVSALRKLPRHVDATSTLAVAAVRKTAKTVAATSTVGAALATTKVKQFAIAVTSTVSAALSRTTLKAVAASSVASLALVRRVGKPISANSTGAVTLAKMVPKALAAATTVGVVLARKVGKPIAAASTIAVALTKSAGKLVAASSTFTAALTRLIGKLVPVTSTLTAVLDTVHNVGSHAYNQAVDIATTIAVAVRKNVPKAVAASSTLAVTLARNVGKLLTATLTAAAALARRVGKTVTVTSVGAAAMVRNVGKLIPTLPGVVASVTKRITHSVAVTSTVAATLALKQSLTKAIAASTTFTVVLSAIKSVSQAIAATTTAAVAMVRRTAKAVAPALTLTTAIRRAIAKPVAVTAMLAVAVARRMTKTIAVAVTDAVTVLAGASHRLTVAASTTLGLAIATAKTKLQAVAATMTAAVGLSRRAGKAVAVTSALAMSLVRSIPKAVAATTTLAVALAKRGVKTIAAATTLAVTLAASKVKVIGVAVTSTIAAAISRRTTHAVAATVTFTAAISRNLRRTIATLPGVVASVNRGVTHSVAVTSTAAVAMVRKIAKAIAATSVIQAALNASKIQGNQNYPQAVAVALNVTVAVSRAIAHQIAVGVSLAAEVTKMMVVRVAAAFTSAIAVLTTRGRTQLVAVATTLSVAVRASAGKLIEATSSFAVDLVREIGVRLQVALLLAPTINRALTKTVAVAASLVAGLRALFSGFSTGKGHRGPTEAHNTSDVKTEADVAQDRTDALVGGSHTDADEWG